MARKTLIFFAHAYQGEIVPAPPPRPAIVRHESQRAPTDSWQLFLGYYAAAIHAPARTNYVYFVVTAYTANFSLLT